MPDASKNSRSPCTQGLRELLLQCNDTVNAVFSEAGFSVLLTFFHHDLQNGPVGLHHARGTDPAHIADGLLGGSAADAVRGLEDHIAHRQIGAHHGGVGGGSQLQCAADLAAVADHAGEVAAHIDDGLADLLVRAAHEPHHGGRGCRGGGNAAAAGGGQLAGKGLDIDVQHVGEGQCLSNISLEAPR